MDRQVELFWKDHPEPSVQVIWKITTLDEAREHIMDSLCVVKVYFYNKLQNILKNGEPRKNLVILHYICGQFTKSRLAALTVCFSLIINMLSLNDIHTINTLFVQSYKYDKWPIRYESWHQTSHVKRKQPPWGIFGEGIGN